MSRPDPQARYSHIAIFLHWAIAALILTNLTIGSFMESLPNPLRGKVVMTHASIGFTVFMLSILRVIWRLRHRPPPFAAALKPWESALARAVHAALYLMMIAMPVIGWLIVSSSNVNRPILMYGLLPVPAYPGFAHIPKGPERIGLHTGFVATHTIGAWIFVALILLHVCGALEHQLTHGHELQRMWFRKRTTIPTLK